MTKKSSSAPRSTKKSKAVPVQELPGISMNSGDEQSTSVLLVDVNPAAVYYFQCTRTDFLQSIATGLITSSNQSASIANLLTVGKGVFSPLAPNDVLVELVFPNEQEFVGHGVVTCIRPLPISRIKKIFVASSKSLNELQGTAVSTDAGIIPDFLVEPAFPSVDVIDNATVSASPLDTNTQQAKTFDKMLGAIAFMKNSGLLLGEKTGVYSNGSDHFLGLAKLLVNDDAISVDTTNNQYNYYKQLFGLPCNDIKPELTWLFERAARETNFTKEDVRIFNNEFIKNHPDITYQQDASIAIKLLLDSLKKNTAPKIIAEIKHRDKFFLYIFSFLYLYGNKTSEDRTNSRLRLPSEVYPPWADFVFALLGYFYGYSLLRNRDESIRYQDKSIEDFTLEMVRPFIKFEMNTLFDYNIIEAVYQLAFKLPNNLGFLKESLDIPNLRLPKFNGDIKRYDFASTEVLGKTFFVIRKKHVADDLITKLERVPERISVLSDLGLYCLKHLIIPQWNLNVLLDHKLTEIKALANILVFRKADLIEHVQSGKVNREELNMRLDITFKYSEPK